MIKTKYEELINGISRPLKIQDTMFQIKYLIEINNFESAYNIIKIYGISIEDILALNFKTDINNFTNFLKIKLNNNI